MGYRMAAAVAGLELRARATTPMVSVVTLRDGTFAVGVYGSDAIYAAVRAVKGARWDDVRMAHVAPPSARRDLWLAITTSAPAGTVVHGKRMVTLGGAAPVAPARPALTLVRPAIFHRRDYCKRCRALEILPSDTWLCDACTSKVVQS